MFAARLGTATRRRTHALFAGRRTFVDNDAITVVAVVVLLVVVVLVIGLVLLFWGGGRLVLVGAALGQTEGHVTVAGLEVGQALGQTLLRRAHVTHEGLIFPLELVDLTRAGLGMSTQECHFAHGLLAERRIGPLGREEYILLRPVNPLVGPQEMRAQRFHAHVVRLPALFEDVHLGLETLDLFQHAGKGGAVVGRRLDAFQPFLGHDATRRLKDAAQLIPDGRDFIQVAIDPLQGIGQDGEMRPRQVWIVLKVLDEHLHLGLDAAHERRDAFRMRRQVDGRSQAFGGRDLRRRRLRLEYESWFRERVPYNDVSLHYSLRSNTYLVVGGGNGRHGLSIARYDERRRSKRLFVEASSNNGNSKKTSEECRLIAARREDEESVSRIVRENRFGDRSAVVVVSKRLKQHALLHTPQ
jgi:hypothetical protein